MAKAKNTVILSAASSALLFALASAAVSRVTNDDTSKELLTNGFIAVDTDDVVDGAATAVLTEAGEAYVKDNKPAEAAAPKTKIGIDTNIPMPEFTRRSPGESTYPFDKLEVGHSFHVPKTAANPDPLTRLSSSISGARLRYSPVLTDAEGKPIMETVEKTIYQTDEAGEYVKDAEGKRVKTGTEQVEREKRGDPTRDFKAKVVDASDPAGEGVRCWRIA